MNDLTRHEPYAPKRAEDLINKHHKLKLSPVAKDIIAIYLLVNRGSIEKLKDSDNILLQQTIIGTGVSITESLFAQMRIALLEKLEQNMQTFQAPAATAQNQNAAPARVAQRNIRNLGDSHLIPFDHSALARRRSGPTA